MSFGVWRHRWRHSSGHYDADMNSSVQVSGRSLWSWLIVLGGVVAQALSGQSILSSASTSSCFLSGELWQWLVGFLGGRMGHDDQGRVIADVDLLPLCGLWLLAAGLSWPLAAQLARRHTGRSWSDSFATAGFAFGWWWLMGAWELIRILAFGIGWESLADLLLVTPQFWQATALAGWLAQTFALSPPLPLSHSRTELFSVQDARGADRNLRSHLHRHELAAVAQPPHSAWGLGDVRGAFVESVAWERFS